MIDYAELEDAIVARLSTLTPAVEIEALPDTPAKFNKPFSKPRVTVAYRSSEYSKEVVRGLPMLLDIGQSVQQEFASVEIVIQGRTVRGTAGCHAVKTAVMERLLGFTPPNWGRITAESYKFIDQNEKDGVFSYALTILTETRSVPKADAENLPTLQELTFNVDSNGGTT